MGMGMCITMLLAALILACALVAGEDPQVPGETNSQIRLENTETEDEPIGEEKSELGSSSSDSFGTGSSFASSGPCTTNGNCVQSPNFPAAYGNSENCVITVGSSGALTVDHFSTEAGYDKLTVGSSQYHGSNTPAGVHVSSGDTIQWVSDGSQTSSGWKICLPAAAAAPRTAAVINGFNFPTGSRSAERAFPELTQQETNEIGSTNNMVELWHHFRRNIWSYTEAKLRLWTTSGDSGGTICPTYEFTSKHSYSGGHCMFKKGYSVGIAILAGTNNQIEYATLMTYVKASCAKTGSQKYVTRKMMFRAWKIGDNNRCMTWLAGGANNICTQCYMHKMEAECQAVGASSMPWQPITNAMEAVFLGIH